MEMQSGLCVIMAGDKLFHSELLPTDCMLPNAWKQF